MKTRHDPSSQTSQILSRPGLPGRERERLTRASDIILVMMADLLVILAALRIFHG
ncbi:hypothetical protein C9413_09895 [Rhizobium sp. SEMIA 4085]|uniref:Uncharacterized protein n=1 Tax=Rhizobium gallicum bv. gallicum R602sp TaxID=1041138 RepID=A0A0B4XEY3_9HYPH|nr:MULTISPECIES: hypothetical protein [Rhizobium]AJD45022.1 hypothetical protein RGR602_PC00991 [Rhizobium gallicum bv. gallicum R602sp]NNH29798.1 hypothetical protein [Rhizobium sp. SEMIA 4085]